MHIIILFKELVSKLKFSYWILIIFIENSSLLIHASIRFKNDSKSFVLNYNCTNFRLTIQYILQSVDWSDEYQLHYISTNKRIMCIFEYRSCINVYDFSTVIQDFFVHDNVTVISSSQWRRVIGINFLVAFLYQYAFFSAQKRLHNIDQWFRTRSVFYGERTRVCIFWQYLVIELRVKFKSVTSVRRYISQR